MRNAFYLFLCLIIFLNAGCSESGQNKLQTLLILDSGNPDSQGSLDYLIPYLNHFGIPFDILDLSQQNTSSKLHRYKLIILAHRNLNRLPASRGVSLSERVSAAADKGTGIVSFDPVFVPSRSPVLDAANTDSLVFSGTSHFVTALHEPGFVLRLFDTMRYPVCRDARGDMLITAASGPLLWADTRGKGRWITWATDEWMKTQVLGPLGGLDDCLWRSMVWAARKPFVMRGLPPMVTMRVDDVAGRGTLWDKSPLYWVETCSKYGFKPWLGLFIYNLTPEAIQELRGYLQEGKATAAPHAFGRPPRTSAGGLDPGSYAAADGDDFYKGYYYYPEALPLRETEYDEFIYFDHQHFKPWNDEEAKRGLGAVDQWYADHQPLPMSAYLIAHWYEMGGNIIPHVAEKWGMEFIAQNKAIDMPWHDTVPWIKQGPFRLHEQPGTSTNNPLREFRGTNPVYYADFTEINGCRFFNCFTEIRDDAGYEWAPDNDVEASAGRGIRQLTRALNSMALAVLFTHETDFIYRIDPVNWERELQLISEGLQAYDPLYVTTDEALKLVRATRTSQISGIRYNIHSKGITVTLSGKSDVPSSFYLFSEHQGQINRKLIHIPVFSGRVKISVDS
ncbi:MAG: hypothetical protein V2B15_19755 [Bacteroidota bacterium]